MVLASINDPVDRHAAASGLGRDAGDRVSRVFHVFVQRMLFHDHDCNAERYCTQVFFVTLCVTTRHTVGDMTFAMEKKQLGRHYLKEWREYRGLSLRKLADRMEAQPGVPITSFANLGRIEKMQQQYSQEIMEAAAVALQCTVADLLTVNPAVESEVVELKDMVRGKDIDTIKAILSALPTKESGAA
ncbi:helix-turn-helix domain-containing protein [Martelella limonii]|uniref:helix-turn-helix domain-containing protein n=1 Tax=Martelella limonii TaxID=1647649 RepID=UPI0019D5C6E1|nr:helix-turn-helix transcriptional regulator [Martelella limonii]